MNDTAAGFEDWPVCGTCKRMLDRHTNGTGVSRYAHADPAVNRDHQAVPVHPSQVDQVDLRCDFCSATDPAWTVPAQTFGYAILPGHNSVGEWLACDPCADLVIRGHWTNLLRRAVEEFEKVHGPLHPAARVSMASLHRQLRNNLTGLPVRRSQAPA